MATKKKNQEASIQDVPETINQNMFYGMRLDDEQLTFANAIWDKDTDIIFCNSKAGTGKTTIATGVANLLIKYGFYKDIIYVMAPYGERKQGYIPGTITEKSSVYFEAFYQALIRCNVNLYTAVNTENMINQKNGTGYITCMTDTFLRGINLDDAVIIIDEAQNYTVAQLKKVLTRIGSKSKVIVIGHDMQCDIDDVRQSGFVKYVKHFSNIDGAEVCTLTNNHRGWISRHADDLDEM